MAKQRKPHGIYCTSASSCPKKTNNGIFHYYVNCGDLTSLPVHLSSNTKRWPCPERVSRQSAKFHASLLVSRQRSRQLSGARTISAASAREDNQYEVEEMLDHRRWRGSLQCKIHSVGYPTEDDSWVAEEDIVPEMAQACKCAGGEGTRT